MAAVAAAAYMHMDSTHSSSSAGFTMSLPPWHPGAVPVDIHHHHHLHLPAVPDDPDLIAAPSPSPPRPRNHHHQKQLRHPGGAARRPSSTSRRRRPRPSRKLPTTYITADPASFRRMVHQVTGADDLPPPLAPMHEATILCRPAPTRVVAVAGALPTLDTSDFLLRSGGNGSGSASRRTTTGPPAVLEVDVGGGGGVGVGLGGAGYGGGAGGSDCGFPTLESWDALLY